MIRLFTISLLLLLIACKGNDRKIETFGENKSEGTVASCPCEDLVENAYKTFEKDGKLYTGTCFINYQNSDHKYIEKQLMDGQLNGSIKYFSRTGEVLFEEKFQQGTHQINLDTENITCNCNELKKNEKNLKYYYRGQIFKGMCFRNFPETDQRYMEIKYANGFRNGYTKYYDKEDVLLFTEEYEAGKLVAVIYPEQ